MLFYSALLCPSKCEKWKFIKKHHIFLIELHNSWFLYPNTKVQASFESKPYQPVKWRIFTAANKKKKLE